MDGEPMKARPTEYENVVYRSKFEAQFAAYMNTDGVISYDFEYEPDWLQVDDYVPDFGVTWKGVRSIYIDVIEVKPSRPTETYIKEFVGRYRRIEKTLRIQSRGMLIWGSLFDGRDRGFLCIDGESPEIRERWEPSICDSQGNDHRLISFVGGRYFQRWIADRVEGMRFDLVKAELSA